MYALTSILYLMLELWVREDVQVHHNGPFVVLGNIQWQRQAFQSRRTLQGRKELFSDTNP